MKRLPIILVILVGLVIASSAIAFILLSKPSAVLLPTEAFTEKTVIAMVIDIEQFDGQASDTIKQSVADLTESFGEMMGGQVTVSSEDLSEMNAGIDRFFGAIADQKIQAFAITMEMDLNELIRNGGEGPPPEPVMTMLVKAGKAPDMATLISAIAGEEMSTERANGMADAISFTALSGGWYAIDGGAPAEMIRVPSGAGDATVAAKFEKGLTHSAGGILQAAFVISEDAANAIAGKMAADMPEDAPEALREVVRTISDLDSIAYALDLNKGIGLRYYVVFENADAAQRMLDAYAEMMANLPALFDAANAVSPVPEEDKEMILAMQERMDEMLNLMEIRREGETVKFEISEEGFSKMIEMLKEMAGSSFLDA